MMTSIWLLFPVFLIFRLLLKNQMSSPRRVESGFQSGHETQFVVSDADIRESDADPPVVRPNAGKFVVPQSFKLL